MVNFMAKAIVILLLVIFVYHIFVSIDLNKVKFWVRIMNKTITWKQFLFED